MNDFPEQNINNEDMTSGSDDDNFESDDDEYCFDDLDMDEKCNHQQIDDLPPPLPLLFFGNDEIIQHSARTIAGREIRCIDHIISKESHSGLSNPINIRYQSLWFSTREKKEQQIRESSTESSDRLIISEVVAYRCTPFFLRGNKNNEPPKDSKGFENDQLGSNVAHLPNVIFDSEFESGNLEKAHRVYGRENLMSSNPLSKNIAGLKFSKEEPSFVHQEYDLFIRKDLHTKGNIQWYYFSVSTVDPSVEDKFNFPLSVRFNIVNMMKKDALYNYGMRPAVYSENKATLNFGWHHSCSDICYFKNRSTYVKAKSKLRNFYTLTFVYTFYQPDTVYFAHSFPYTYTRLNRFLTSLETDARIAQFTRRKLMTLTLANNRCDILTITSPSTNPVEFSQRPAIFVTARVHPGETNSSFAVEGFIRYLTSNDPGAIKLRDAYVFKIVPMLNPDGVIHGNYRCSLAGVDLNRQYNRPDQALHPTIYTLKSLIASTCEHRGVSLYLDLHGHSQLKNVFLYGCDHSETFYNRAICKEQQTDEDINKKLFSRLFPKILTTVSNTINSQSGKCDKGYFSYEDCVNTVQKNKKSTGRVVCWRNLHVRASYTVEISFCGNGNNSDINNYKKFEKYLKKCNVCVEQNGFASKTLDEAFRDYKLQKELLDSSNEYKIGRHYSEHDLFQIGEHLARGILSFSNLDNPKYSTTCLLQQRNLSEANHNLSINYTSVAVNLNKTMLSKSGSNSQLTSRKQIVQELTNDLNISDPTTETWFDSTNIIELAEQLKQPILKPAIISPSLLSSLCSDDKPFVSSFIKSIRVQTENDIRRMLMNSPLLTSPISKNELKNDGEGRQLCSSNANNSIDEIKTMNPNVSHNDIETLSEMSDGYNAGDGSDSDPSGDDIPTSKLLRSESFLSLAKISGVVAAKIKSLRRKASFKSKTKPKSKKDSNKSNANSKIEVNSQPSPIVTGSKRRNQHSFAASHRVAIVESARIQYVADKNYILSLGNKHYVDKDNSLGQSTIKSSLKIQNFEIEPIFQVKQCSLSFGEFKDVNSRKERLALRAPSPSTVEDNKSSSSTNMKVYDVIHNSFREIRSPVEFVTKAGSLHHPPFISKQLSHSKITAGDMKNPNDDSISPGGVTSGKSYKNRAQRKFSGLRSSQSVAFIGMNARGDKDPQQNGL